MSRKAAVRALSAATSRLEVLDAGEDIAESFTRQLLLESKPGNGPYSFKWSYLRAEILSKYCRPDPSQAAVRVERAVAKLLESEIRCAELNRVGITHPDWPAISHMASRIVSHALGDVRTLFRRYEEGYSFPSGATTCFRRRQGDPYFRFNEARSSDVTSSAFRYATQLRLTTPRWVGVKFNVVRGNEVFTVPKANDIDRCACKEPGMNQTLQRTVGDYIRGRLKSCFGIDLNDQSRNRSLARRGSVTDRLATLDLSSASDSISCRLVDELLPLEWSHYLNQIRSRFGKLPDGRDLVWEKHSTMGNGYTFELESLLFYALVMSAIELERVRRGKNPAPPHLKRLVSVYGDDIICPGHYYNPVVAALSMAGFLVNDKKSFHRGPFRESCGGHYYLGHDVKPFYIRKPIDSLSRMIWLLNALRAWAADHDGWCDPSVYNMWLAWKRKYVPRYFLGGRNCDSITELVSPEGPRFSVLQQSLSFRAVGYPALLRSFSLSMGDRPQYGAHADRAEFPLDRVQKPEYRPVSVKAYRPFLRKYFLFPQEAVEPGNWPSAGYRDYHPCGYEKS